MNKCTQENTVFHRLNICFVRKTDLKYTKVNDRMVEQNKNGCMLAVVGGFHSINMIKTLVYLAKNKW